VEDAGLPAKDAGRPDAGGQAEDAERLRSEVNNFE